MKTTSPKEAGSSLITCDGIGKAAKLSCLRAYVAAEVAERDQRIAELEAVLRDIGAYKGEGGPGTPWRGIVRDVGAQARAAIAKAEGGSTP